MNTVKNLPVRRASFIIVALGLTVIFAGCSGGSLTTREKGAGIGLSEGQLPEDLLEPPLVIPVLGLLLAVGLDWRPVL